MRHGLTTLMLGVLLFSGVYPASAVVITVDPDNFVVGTNLSRATPGVNVSHVSQLYGEAVQRGDVYAAPCTPSDYTSRCVESAGAMAFGASPAGPVGLLDLGDAWCYFTVPQCPFSEQFSVIELAFDVPTSFAQVTLGVWNDHLWPGFYAMNSAGQAIATCTAGYPGDGCGTFVYPNNCVPYGPECVANVVISLDRAGADISRIIVGGTGDSATLNQFSFEYRSVPEPGTLALLSVGLAGLGLSRRRRAH